MNKKILNWVLAIGIIFIFFGVMIVLEEILTAKQFCNKQYGKFRISLGKYYCDEEQLFRYTNGWDFNRTFVDLKNYTIEFP